MSTRMLSSTFGSINYNSGVIPAGQPAAPGGQSVDYTSPSNIWGVDQHDDVLYTFASGEDHNAGRFLAYDQHDLRDLLTEGKCLANAMINVQRMKETPVAISCYNVAPLRNIYEVIIVTNSSLDLSDGKIDGAMQMINKAGFGDSFINRNAGKLNDQREILYCERRVYGIDTSQQFFHPASMGQMAAPPAAPPAGVNTRWINNFVLLDRTVTGEADLVIGPDLQVLRWFFVSPFERSNQTVSTTLPPEHAEEYTYLDSQVFVTFPAFSINIIGEERDMTATEKAVEYSNVFLSNQNPPN